MPRKGLRLAIGQMNAIVGGIEENAEKIVQLSNDARQNMSGLLVTPELSLVGYPPLDLVYKNHFLTEQYKVLRRIAHEVALPTLVGFIDTDEKGHLYNAAALIYDGEIHDVFHKHLLPTYGVFDEARHFTSGEDGPYSGWHIFDLGDMRIALTICEDMWDEGYSYSPIQEALSDGSDFIINMSASPWEKGKFRQRVKVAKKHTMKYEIPLVYCNLVGGQDELVFDGASFVMDGEGELKFIAPPFEESLSFVEIGTLSDKATVGYNDDSVVSVYKALVLGVKDYCRKTGFSKAVIGLSGGIDSAVTACLAVAALGAENITGISMPSEHNSVGTRTDARELAENLGIRFHEISIQDSIDLAVQRYLDNFGNYRNGVTLENLQARERGKLLMEYSNDNNAIVLSTGNKTENALGYSTLYGDMCGGLNVIGDINKPEVYLLANYINAEVYPSTIPLTTLVRKPSAELAEAQVDPFDYNIIGPLVDDIVETNAGPDDLDEYGMTSTELMRIFGLIRRAEYKRKQAAPVIKVSSIAFGIGRRMPIVNRYEW